MKLVNRKGQDYSLELPRVTIGAAPDNHIRVTGPGVAPYQAIIRRDGDAWFLDYLNGAREQVMVNGYPLAGYYRLQPGDRVTVGGAQFAFYDSPALVPQVQAAPQVTGWQTPSSRRPTIVFDPLGQPARSTTRLPAPHRMAPPARYPRAGMSPRTASPPSPFQPLVNTWSVLPVPVQVVSIVVVVMLLLGIIGSGTWVPAAVVFFVIWRIVDRLRRDSNIF